MSVIHDPWYTLGAALEIKQRLGAIGLSVVTTPGLTSQCAVHRDEDVVWVRPGLDLPTFHRLVVRASAYWLWGDEVAPEFLTPHRPDRATSAGAVVMPLRRRASR